MKVSKIAVVAAAASALVLAGCSSSKSGDAASTTAASDNAKYNICMVTHGDGGGFWSVAKAGAERAASDLGVTFKYEETTNDAEKQAQLIQADTTSGCQAIAASAPNPDAIKDAMLAAKAAGIPTVTMNSGSKVFKELGAFTHVGQDEFVAGQGAGLKFKEAGKKHVLCVIQEANNIGLQERCDGAKDTFGNVTNLQLSAGLADLDSAGRPLVCVGRAPHARFPAVFPAGRACDALPAAGCAARCRAPAGTKKPARGGLFSTQGHVQKSAGISPVTVVTPVTAGITIKESIRWTPIPVTTQPVTGR